MCVCNLLQFDSAFGYYWEKYMKIIWDLIRAHISEAVNSARTDPGSYPYEKQVLSLSGVTPKGIRLPRYSLSTVISNLVA